MAYAVEVNPRITAEQLYSFYERNAICERGFGQDVAARVLDHPHLIAAAFDGAELVGLARALFDGLSAHVMELSVDLRFQGANRHRNGSLVEVDRDGLGAALGRTLLAELERMDCTFVSAAIVAGVESDFYSTLGFQVNQGMSTVCIDRRPYVTIRD